MASSFNPYKYDIGIVNVDAVNVGFMLAQKNGAPIYQVLDDEYLAAQFFTDVPGYGALPSEKELALRQDSWRAGFGLDVYDADEPERYYDSRGMDMRFRGMGIAGMKPTGIVTTANPINNKGLEAWATSNVTAFDWTKVGDIEKSDLPGQVHGGKWACRFLDSTSQPSIRQTISLPVACQGALAAVNCWALTNQVNAVHLIVSDGYNSVTATHVGNGLYHQLTCPLVINTKATEINVFAGSIRMTGTNAYVDDFSINYPDTPVVYPRIVDEGIEAWDSATDLAAWQEIFDSSADTGVYQNDIAANIHSGSYSARLRLNSASAPVNYFSAIFQQVAWSNLYRGRQVIVNAWVQTGSALANVTVNDGVNRTVKPAVANGIMQLVSAQHNIAWNATQLNVYVSDAVLSASAFNTFVDDVSIYIPGANVIKKMTDYNDKLYFGAGTAILRMNETNGSIVLANSVPENISSLEPFTNNLLHVALNYGTIPYRYMNASEQLTAAGAGVNTFQFLKTVHSATPTMWGNDGNNTIRSNPTPSDAATWSGQTTVGSNYHSITDLLTRSAALFIMKEDMPYYLDSTGAVKNDLAPKLISLTSSTSGKNAHTDGDKIWIPAGAQSLIEEDSGALTWRTPALFSTNLTSYSGRVAAVTSDDMYVYVIVNGSGVCQVLAGRNEVIGTSTQWVWHPIAEIPISSCETAYVSSVYQKRLWISSTTGELFYLPLYSDYGNPVSDTNRNFQTNAEMQTPWLHGNFRDTTKAFPKITTLLGHAYNSGVFFNCYYKKLEDSSWTQVADLVGNANTRIATSFLPDDGSSNHPTSTLVRFKFVANTAHTDKTPVLLGYNAQALLYPPKRALISCVVRVSEDILLKDGTRDTGSQVVADAVLAEAIKAKWPVTFYDIDGNQKYVKFLPLPSGTPRWTPVVDEKTRKSERWYALLLQQIDLS